MQEIVIPIIDNINPYNKTISIAMDRVIVDANGNQIAKVSRVRRAFVPGEIEQVKEWLGATESPEIDYLSAIWTPEVIAAYQELLNAAE